MIQASATILFAEDIDRDLQPFSRIIVSPHINLILKEGEKEGIRLEYHGVNLRDINIEVEGKTLRIFLKDARVTDKTERRHGNFHRSKYSDVSITAYVTYTMLENLEIRGNQELTCLSPLRSKKFKLRAYGENEINLSSVNTAYFKANLYGENTLKIKGGKADYQKYKVYGENKIDATRMKSYSAVTMLFGESEIDLYSQDELRISSFGEARISYTGDPFVSRGLVFGKTRIRRND
jgi:hypothetical protein